MSDLTYSELQNLTYDELSAKTYSLEGETGSGSNTSGGSCIWTESRIAAIENRLSSIESALAKLATSEALLTAREDILSTVSLYASTIPENVWNYSEGRTVETSTLAQASELAEVRALLDHWSVSGNVLTTFDTSGNTLSVRGLTRDTDGNIIGVG